MREFKRYHGKGEIWVEVLEASKTNNPFAPVSFNDSTSTIVTFRLHYPRIIHSELMTHCMLARNAASSRAIPAETMFYNVESMPAMPVRFGENQGGMQDKGISYDAPIELPLYDRAGGVKEIYYTPERAWTIAMENALEVARAFHRAGYHKQVFNRLLEPFQFMHTIVTATDWDNFFWLRTDDAADPTIKELADVMLEAYTEEVLNKRVVICVEGDWHLPFIERREIGSSLSYFLYDEELTVEEAKMASAVGCSQVSYRKTDLQKDTIERVFSKLVGSEKKHASAFEHQATPLSLNELQARQVAKSIMLNQFGGDNVRGLDYSGKFKYWHPYRYEIEGEYNQDFLKKHQANH